MRLPLAASPQLRLHSLIPLAAAGVAAFVALVAGMATVVSPAKAVAFSALAVFGPITLINLPLGLALWATTLSLGSVVGIGLASSAGGLWIMFVWLGVIAGRRESVREVLTEVGGTLAPAIGLLLWLALSFVWADRADLVQAELLYWAFAVMLLVIVVTTLDTPDKVRLVATGFVVGAVASVLAGLISGDLTAGGTALETAKANEGRFTSAGNDPNELAAGLVAATAVAVGMLPGARGPRRMLLVLAILVMALGTAATQSRGGLVAAAACVLAAIVLARGHRIQAFSLAAIVTLVGLFVLASTPGALERVTNFDNGGNGRSELWTIGWRIFEDHPVNGVGLGQFREVSADYVREPGNLKFVDLIAERPHIVHNTYLQLMAESGVISLVLYLLVIALALLASWRAASAFERAGRDDLQALAQGVLIAQIGILTAAFFLSIGSSFRVWLLLGLGPALLSATRRGIDADPISRPAR